MALRKIKLLKLGVISVIVFASISALTVYNFFKSKNQVQINEINLYVCEIVDVNMDSRMMGLRCMVKDQKE